MIDHNIVERLIGDLTDDPTFESDPQAARWLTEHLVAAGWIHRDDTTENPQNTDAGSMR